MQNWEREPVFLAASKMLADKELGELQSFAWTSVTRIEEGNQWQATSWRTVRRVARQIQHRRH